MRACVLGLISIVSWGCSSGAGLPMSPTAPTSFNVLPIANGPAVISRVFPSLTGQWRGGGTAVFRNLETGNALTFGSCSGTLTVTSQQDNHFSGQLDSRGFGWNSDRFCTASGTMSGELVAVDGSATAHLEGNFENWPRPAITPSCEMISAGDGIWIGSVATDAIRLRVTDTLRCPASADGGPVGMPMANFERTVSLVFQR
jgi:hypothetical protein